jgi:hypothetical protein
MFMNATERTRTRIGPPYLLRRAQPNACGISQSSHPRIHSFGCICNFDTSSAMARLRFGRPSLAGKNLSQVLENMDSQSEKSTVQSLRQHFVSVCTHAAQALRSKNRLPLYPKITNAPALSCSHRRVVVYPRSTADVRRWSHHRPHAPTMLYWQALSSGLDCVSGRGFLKTREPGG